MSLAKIWLCLKSGDNPIPSTIAGHYLPNISQPYIFLKIQVQKRGILVGSQLSWSKVGRAKSSARPGPNRFEQIRGPRCTDADDPLRNGDEMDEIRRRAPWLAGAPVEVRGRCWSWEVINLSASFMIVMWSEDSLKWSLEGGSQVLGNPSRWGRRNVTFGVFVLKWSSHTAWTWASEVLTKRSLNK